MLHHRYIKIACSNLTSSPFLLYFAIVCLSILIPYFCFYHDLSSCSYLNRYIFKSMNHVLLAKIRIQQNYLHLTHHTCTHQIRHMPWQSWYLHTIASKYRLLQINQWRQLSRFGRLCTALEITLPRKREITYLENRDCVVLNHIVKKYTASCCDKNMVALNMKMQIF